MKKLLSAWIKTLLAMLLILCYVTPVTATTDKVRQAVRSAIQAGEQGDYARQFRLLETLLLKGQDTIGRDAYLISRAELYKSAFNLASSGGEENCSVALKWASKGTRYGPPDYTEPFDDYYPLLLSIRGSCLYQNGDRSQSHAVLSQAKEQCKKISDPGLSEELCANIAGRLEKFSDQGISTGSYVTHRGGFLQNWIGRVVDRQGDRLEVRVTYVNRDADTGFEKGDSVKFLQDEVKALRSISPDAALRGWK